MALVCFGGDGGFGILEVVGVPVQRLNPFRHLMQDIWDGPNGQAAFMLGDATAWVAARALDIAAAAGVPVMDRNATVRALVMVLDRKPRPWGNEDLQVLQDLSAFAASEIERYEDAPRNSEVLRQSAQLAMREAELHGAEERFRVIADITSEGVWSIDREGRTLDVNARMAELLCCDRALLLEQELADFMFPEDVDAGRAHIASALSGVSERFGFRLRRNDASELFVRARGSALKDGNGEIIGALTLFADITEHTRAAEALRANEDQLSLIAHALPVYILHCDTQFRYKFVNKAYAARLGTTPEALLGRRIRDVLGDEVWQGVEDKLRRVLEGELVDYEARIPYPGIGARFMRSVNVPERDNDGNVRGLIGVLIDISEQKQMEEERAQLLQQSLEQATQLRAADRAKDEFLATLSHELRNPLAPLRNSLALLRMSGNATASAPIHEMMERQVNHLVRLVDDLLEMSRISRGTFALRKERVNVAAIVGNAVETSEPLLQAAKHTLSVSLPHETLWLEGDPVRLAQILANLLNNAARYTDDGGQISVHAQRQDGVATISVRDNGIGIEPDSLPRMFEMFSRGDRATTRGQGGLGIGLALARRLAEMHGGTVDAHSQGARKGSEFTVRLPLAGDQRPALPVEGRIEAAIPQRRILVVDDNRDAADSLGMILRFLGAEVRVARDGLEALEAFQSYDPSVVLLDIGMPGMDGYEVARTIRSRFPGSRSAIVALSGWGQEKDRRRAREAGFDHHLIKPADIGALQALLASLDDNAGDGTQANDNVLSRSG